MSTSTDTLRLSLGTLFTEWADAPLASVDKTLAKIATTDSVAEMSQLNAWADQQRVCTVIVKHHGTQTLERILKAIAVSSKRVGCPMSGRIQSIADFHEL